MSNTIPPTPVITENSYENKMILAQQLQRLANKIYTDYQTRKQDKLTEMTDTEVTDLINSLT
jgi:UDP-N-acetylglucosamine enolpyruvyl transferase